MTIATTDRGEILESVLIEGNLNKLTEQQRVDYMMKVCDTLGLNPFTKPFAYITLQGRMTLYALRDCTDQLRKRDDVSVKITGRENMGEVYVVTARATLPNDRCDESTGVVATGHLKGDGLANAMMKAETKAKRRVTLSICGLGWLDETEVGTIPDAHVVETTGEELPKPSDTGGEPPEPATEEPNGTSPWHSRPRLIQDIVNTVPRYANKPPAALGALRKLELAGSITWAMGDDDVLVSVEAYAQKRDREKS